MPSALRLLSNIIAEAVDTIEGVYVRAGVELPGLDEPYDPADPSEVLRSDPAVAVASLNLVAAAAQITAATRQPVMSGLVNAHAFQISSCIRVASELNVVELLREAGPKGLHAKEIAAPSHADPGLTGLFPAIVICVDMAHKPQARILRLLASHHIFREVSPDVFANNRISSSLDKGKPSTVLFEKREDRLSGTTGSAALLEFLGDECFKSSSQLGDALLDPTGEQNPMTRAFGLKEPMFNWFMRPENRNRITRFALAMHGIAATEPLELIHKGYDWSQLPTGSVLVDVGGGLGSTSMEIAKKYPSLKIVNQDLAPTIENAKSHWALHFPEHFEKKIIELQVHDFFQPQPIQNADIFLLRHVVHDWSDEKSITILKHLRDAAKPTTQLVVIENIVPFACALSESQDSEFSHIPGAVIHQSPPAPLLSNQGVAIAMMYYYDITIHNLIGGKDRTVGGFAKVSKKAGWDIVHIYRCHGSAEGQCHIVGVPI